LLSGACKDEVIGFTCFIQGLKALDREDKGLSRAFHCEHGFMTTRGTASAFESFLSDFLFRRTFFRAEREAGTI